MSNNNGNLKYKTHIILVLFSIAMLFPVIWWVGATFKTIGEMSSANLFPTAPTLQNYIKGWNLSKAYTFTHFFKNNMIMEVLNVFGSVISSSLVAFGFARVNFKFKSFWFSILMLTLMLPSQVTVVSQYIMYSKLHFTDSYFPLIFPHFLGGGAFFIFLLIQFIRAIPKELDEAATIDGASTFGIYWRVILPLIVPALVTVGIFTFIWSWDDFYSQVLYLSSISKFTVGLALRMFIDQFEVQWGQLLAISLLSILPSVILFFSAQKQFVEGIATTGIKG